MKPRLALRAWCLLLFGLTGACDLGEPTQITLRVDGDLHAVDGFDAVLVNAFHLKGEELSAQPDRWFPGSRYQRGEGMVLDQREYVARHSRLYRVDDDPLPIELAFYPKAGDSTRVALFEAFGMRCGATAPSHECEIIVSTGARTQFVRDRHETLTLYLSAACRGVVCPAGAYCRLGRCLDPDIDPECFDASGVPCAEGDAAVSDAVASGDASTPDGTVIPDGAADGGAGRRRHGHRHSPAPNLHLRRSVQPRGCLRRRASGLWDVRTPGAPAHLSERLHLGRLEPMGDLRG